ncbi:hypothetical protein B0T17DRAFT_616625 [Bombardia bombarda]|uniref:ADF-H domain-containing protein n=1 Tax=Bombardia bombarda TaxID=252184 RepID=A0AA40CB29_9PEZI|nr:hypothetical protein B0T17DRAFT_616625 [Bombardia bombarda]
MQSGISASQELASQFNTLLASDAHFGLLITIASEQLQPLKLLTASSAGGSFADNVSALLTPHVKPNEALYIILRRYTSSPALVAVTFVPDTAPVRQKMLFAATRLTLVRELGSEHFRDTIFATTPHELSPAGFEKHDAHVALDAPLTEEEKSLGEVKRAEQEAGSGTGSRDIRLSKNLAVPVDDDAMAAMKELGDECGSGLVMLKINESTQAIELVPSSATPSSIPELLQAISPTEPCFTFYRFANTYGGGSSSPVLFFYTCPATPGPKAIKKRMLYPLSKRAVLEIAEKEAGIKIEKKFEVEDPSEITEAGVLEELHPKVEARKGFSRPKRPGR